MQREGKFKQITVCCEDFYDALGTNLDKFFDCLFGDIKQCWSSPIMGALVHGATCIDEKQYNRHVEHLSDVVATQV